MTYAETDRLILRSWKPEDLPVFVEINRDPEVMKYFPAPLSDEETAALYHRVQDELARKGWGMYAVEIKNTGEFAGFVGLHEIGFDADFTPGTEIAWRLGSQHHNKGYATEAATAVLHIARNNGFPCLYSFTAVPNKPSERVMQKIGMAKIGEFEHPALPVGDWLKTHVLYRIEL